MKRILLLVNIVFIFCFTLPGQGAAPTSEAKLKAAYLYNFAKFIQWPEESFAGEQTPLVIGVLGKITFQEELPPLTEKTVRARPIVIRHFATVEEVRNCHLLYIGSSLSESIGTLLGRLRSQSVVTVSDGKKFAAGGGIIQFVTRRDRLRFVVNLTSAQENNIKIHSQLLSLAVEVMEKKK